MFFKFTLILSFIVMPLHAILSDDEGDPDFTPTTQFLAQKASSFDRVAQLPPIKRYCRTHSFHEDIKTLSIHLIPEEITNDNIRDLGVVLNGYQNRDGLIYVSSLLGFAGFPKLTLNNLLAFIHVILNEEDLLMKADLPREQIDFFFKEVVPSSVNQADGLSMIDYVLGWHICDVTKGFMHDVFDAEEEDSTQDDQVDTDPS